MFKIVKQVSNTRVQKDEGAAVVTAPTEGLVRITKAAQDALGVTDINRIVVLECELEDGSKANCIYVSPYAHKKNDATGELEVDDDGKAILELVNENAPKTLQGLGRKLGFPNGNSGSLQFSCMPSWELLKGTSEGSNHWKIKGLVEGEEDFKSEAGGVTVYALELIEDKFSQKTERKTKAEA